jgi:hypothetical protein
VNMFTTLAIFFAYASEKTLSTFTYYIRN